MPYYDYVCSDCDSKFEVKRSMNDLDAPATCPECHGHHTARKVSRVAAFAHGSDGSVSAVGGGGCGSCGSGGSCGGGGCGSCSSRN